MRVIIINKKTGFERRIDVPTDRRGQAGVAMLIKQQLGLKG